MTFINWGNETPEQREARRRFEESMQQHNMMKRMFEAKKLSSTQSSFSSGAGPGAFGVTVQGSIVSGAWVKIGWPRETIYTNVYGETVEMTSDSMMGVEYAQTDSAGKATFSKFNPAWVIHDYATGSLVKRYAPIVSVGGTADDGYYPAPMSANVSVNYVNPITTILAAADDLVSDKSFKEYSDWDNVVQVLSELTQYDFSDDDVVALKSTGYSPTAAYEPFTVPLRNVEKLLSAAGIDNDDIPDSEIPDASLKRSSLIWEASIGEINLNSYFNKRKNNQVPASTLGELALEFVPTVSKLTSNILIGYSVNNESFATDVIAKLYDVTASENDFTNIFTNYEGDTDIGGGGGVKPPSSGTITVIEADPYTGYFKVTVADDTISMSSKVTGRGSTNFSSPITLTFVSTQTVSGVPVNTYEGTVDSWSLTPDADYDTSIFSVSSELAVNRVQRSQEILYVKGPNDTSAFVSVIDGTSLPGSTVHPKPSQVDLNLYLDKTAITLSSQSPNKIGENEYWVGAYDFGDGNGEVALYVYWDGKNWVLDVDTSPKAVIASGPLDIGSPVGGYAIVDQTYLQYFDKVSVTPI